VKLKRFYILFIVLFGVIFITNGQNISLYNQFNGRFNFTFIGNTLNVQPNGANDPCLLLPSSDATLNLSPTDVIENAYLYWAGSGTGDFNVKLNGIDITSQRNFSAIQSSNGNPFFSAFADVTTQLQTTGNGLYTFSDLDVSPFLNPDTYCNNGTNFSGWAIVIVFGNPTLPLNQINVYDGLEALSTAVVNVQDQLIINLGNLNVLDNSGAELGFVAWEGDANIANQESLLINGNIINNPPLNPGDNAFNGTNSITGSTSLYNMDLDIYDIQNNISIGNYSVEVKMTTAQDFVLINTIVTKLNSQLPDATVAINSFENQCDSRTIVVNYTISNINSTNPLPAQTPISIYINNQLLQTTTTNTEIPVDGSISSQITLVIPNLIPDTFEIKFVVDDTGNGIGIVTELNETNNSISQSTTLWVSPQFNILPDWNRCVSSYSPEVFDLTNYITAVRVNPNDTVQFFTSFNDAVTNTNPITNFANFTTSSPQTTIFIRIDNAHCYSITSLKIFLRLYPTYNAIPNSNICRINENTAFDFTPYVLLTPTNPSDSIHFFSSLQDANNNTNPILNSSNYQPDITPKSIYIRLDNEFCYSITSFVIDYYEVPKYNPLSNMVSCNEGFNKATFNLTLYEPIVKQNPADTVTFYENYDNASNAVGTILDPYFYVATTPKEIFIRIDNENCFSITSFLLTTRNCPPTVYNYISANNDTYNDILTIDGLYDIFLDFKIEIYNRWGRLIWIGNQNTDKWTGQVKDAIGSENAADGTYFYLLFLNDIDYPEPLKGFLYLNH
jgi:gliding motility-associated-like protein